MPLLQLHNKDDITGKRGRLIDRVLEGALVPCILWIFLVGLWSGPMLGASLVYPNGVQEVEFALIFILIALIVRRRVVAVGSYPFLLPCLGVLIVAALAAAARMAFLGIEFEGLRLWQHGEPMLRGLLIYVALAGRPWLLRAAFAAALLGIGVLATACVVQHITGVTRWYVSLCTGWESGIRAMRDTPRVQGLTSYINLTAALLAAAMPCWMLLTMRTAARWGTRAWLGAGGILTATALWYTDSRGPMVALLIVVCLVVWRLAPRWRWSALAAAVMAIGITMLPAQVAAPVSLVALALGLGMGLLIWRRRAVLLVPLALALALVGGIQSFDAYVLHRPLGLRITERGFADQARMALYRETLVKAVRSPLWGVGDHALAMWLLTSPETTRFKLDKLPRTQWNAHNQSLHWAAAEGLPVALAFTVLVIGAVWWLWRHAPRAESPFARALARSLAAALTIFLLTNLGEAHFWRIEGGGFFWSLLGMGAAALRR